MPRIQYRENADQIIVAGIITVLGLINGVESMKKCSMGAGKR